jgi:hypothetical protein
MMLFYANFSYSTVFFNELVPFSIMPVVPRRGVCNLTLSIQAIQARYLTKIRHIHALFLNRPLMHFNLLMRTSQHPRRADKSAMGAIMQINKITDIRRCRFIGPPWIFRYLDYFVKRHNRHLRMSGIFCEKSYAVSTKNMNGGRPHTCHVLLQELDLLLSVSS